MVKNSSNKLAVGIFVTIALVFFILGIYFIGERQQLFRNTFRVTGIFKNVSGLQIGNNVRFSGIDVGTVDNMSQVTDTTVKVEMQIDERIRKFLRKNSKASIGSDGLMGNKIVLIAPGTDDQRILHDNDNIDAVSPIDMDDVLIKLKTTGDNAASITTDLAAIVKNIRSGRGTVGKLFTDTVFANNISSAIVNVKQGAEGLKRNMDAASKSFLLKGLIKKNKKEEEEKKGAEK